MFCVGGGAVQEVLAVFLRNGTVCSSIAFGEMCYKIKKTDKIINFAKNNLQQKPALSISERKQV